MKKIDLVVAQKLYESGSTLKEIGLIFDVSDETIRTRFKKNGIRIKNKSEAKRKYILDEDFFNNIDDEFKSYFLGLIFSDGWVNKNTLSIQLSEQDKDILIKFQESLKTIKPLIFKKAKKDTHQNQFTLKVSSDKMINDLFKLGVCENKTHLLIFRTDFFNEKKLIKHFIRGVFDGDGTTHNAYFSIVGTEKFLAGIRDYLKQENINLGIYNAHCKSKDIKRLAFNNRAELAKIFNYLYDDSNIFMERKKNKFINYFKKIK
jgi:hypothetical protein